MIETRFRKVLASGKDPVGHMVWEFGTRGIPRILDSTGVDFVVFDMEHSSFDLDHMANVLAGCHGCSFTPFVRVPQCLYHFMARVMDAGAMGVMVPNVVSAEQARLIVDSVKYAPLGRRGVALGVAHTGYVVPKPTDYFREANAATTIICQIESPEGVENASAIAATDGVDCLWVGHFDLSQAMGIPAEFHNPRFLEALNKVVHAAKSHDKLLGIQPASKEQAEEWRKLGFHIMSWGSDTAVYAAALKAGLATLRGL